MGLSFGALVAWLHRWRDHHSELAYGLLLALVALVVVLCLLFLQPTVSQIVQDTMCLQCTK